MSGLLFGTGLVCALVYVGMINGAVSPLRSVFKTLPLLCFAGAAWVAGAPVYLVMGLLLSALGDWSLSRDGDAAFLYGLAAFALAHIVYVLAFTGVSNVMPWEAFVERPILAGAMIAIAVSSELWLAPYVGALVFPVRIYVAVIAMMALSAMVLPFAYGLAALGAALFVLSDLILSAQLFRLSAGSVSARIASYGVWGFYIGGQALICAAFIDA